MEKALAKEGQVAGQKPGRHALETAASDEAATLAKYDGGPAFAADAPLQPVPYDAAVKTKEVRPLPCSSSGQGYGSYQPVTAQDEENGISNDLAPLAWQTFTQNNSITGCQANSVHPVSYKVTQACKQVVAGTNYAFQFQAYFDCTSQQGLGSFGFVTLDAIVFKPLENVKQNIIPPQVTNVWNVTQA
ncbi:g7724 [Coccomyxa elongata]